MKYLEDKIENKNYGNHDRTETINLIVNKRICVGCGACTVICPKKCINIVYGLRFNFPKIHEDECIKCGKCLRVCPSAFLLYDKFQDYENEINEKNECFIIHADDDEVRIDAASGGFITGIILHLIDSGMADGAIVARCQGEKALIAASFIAADRESVLSARGSKYTPVSNCTVVREVLDRPGRYVFVGTPCMIEALMKMQELLPELKKYIVLSIGFVCAGMASRLSTKSYIESDGGVNIKDVRRICYRGNGWPGRFRVYGDNNQLLMDRPLINGSLTHVVGRDHYLRCENCFDHWAKYADIVVSDPWTEEMIRNETKGRSAIMIRTERGRKAVNSAVTSGKLISNPLSAEDFTDLNKHLDIKARHPRHSWMLLFQIIFMGRMKNVLSLIRFVIRRKILVGVRTTLKARFQRNYYY